MPEFIIRDYIQSEPFEYAVRNFKIGLILKGDYFIKRDTGNGLRQVEPRVRRLTNEQRVL